MSKLSDLQQRLNAALEKLEASAGNGDAAAHGRISELESQNRALADDLSALQEARTRDLAELDALITQLKPLVEEGA